MSEWVDKRKEVQGPGLHALVIGVSDYEFLPRAGEFPKPGHETLGLSKVNICARGAFRVARWLRDEYWHPTVQVKTIRLLLSPSASELEDPEIAEAARSQPRGTTANVWAALQAWQIDCRGHPDDIAVLYVAGHGIQWGSKDDAIVLLEDFSKDQLFINQTIDVGRTLKGMSGENMPQTQMYFADACRIQPDAYKTKYEDAGSGLYLRSEFTGDDLRAAPIFYASCPETAALGNRPSGTYFAEALVDCLKSFALTGPAKTSGLAIARTHWHVSISSLLNTLQDRVTEIAGRDRKKQEVVLGGNSRPAVFCAAQSPPGVPLILAVDPEAAAQVAHAELWTYNRSMKVRDRTACSPPPLRLNDVPVGVYLLEIFADAPYKTRTIAVQLERPQWIDRITLE